MAIKHEEIKIVPVWKRTTDRLANSVKNNYARLFELANLNLQVLDTSTQIEKLLK